MRRLRSGPEQLEPRLLLACDLDTNFGTDGSVIQDFNGRLDLVRAVAVQPNGRILVAGESIATADNDHFALARYLSDGTLDASFGTGGLVTTDVGATTGGARDMAVQSDGKIVVVGTADRRAEGQQFDFVVVRYNSDGSLDATFGNGGIVYTDFFPALNLPLAGSTNDTANAVSIDSEGRILVAGQGGGTTDIAIARYLPDGTLDAGFASGRLLTAPFNTHVAFDLVVAPDDSFIVAGSNNFPAGQPLFFRYLADGTLDANYADGGFAGLESHVPAVRSLAISFDDEGQLVVAGTQDLGGPSRRAFASRLTTDGSLDVSFGNLGVATLTAGGPFTTANAVLSLDGGFLLVAGTAGAISTDNFLLASLTPDGNLDSGFDTDGIMTCDFGGGLDEAYALALQENGQIVVAGGGGPAGFIGSDFVLARLQNYNPNDSDNDGVPNDVEDANPVSPPDLGHPEVHADRPFSQQGNVASFPNAKNGQYVTLIAPTGTLLQAIEALRPVPPGNSQLPTGALVFDVIEVTPGASIEVDVHFEEPIQANAYFKFGSTAHDTTAHWYDFAFDANANSGAELFDADADGLVEGVRLHLTDGGAGDYDRTVNGRIRDPGGLGQTSLPSGTVDLEGYKFWDLDGDGTPDAGEPRLAGWTVFLDKNKNGVLDAGETSTVTDADGRFTFSGLNRDTYFVAEVAQTGWRQTAPPAFNAPTSVQLSYSGRGITIGHLNPDEDLLVDMIGVNFGFVELLFQNGDGTFRSRGLGATGALPEAAVIEDLNADGFPDVAAVYTGFFDVVAGVETAPAEVHVFYGRGGRRFDDATIGNGRIYHVAGQLNGAFYGTEPYQLVAGDINGDGLIDLVTDSQNDSTLTVLLGTPNGAFRGTVEVVSLDAPATGLALFDFDGDSALEIVVSDAASGYVTVIDDPGQANETQTQFWTGGGGPGPTGVLPLGRLTTGDFDGDGDSDAAVLGLAADSSEIVLMNNSGAGDLRLLVPRDLHVQQDPRDIRALDKDGDGDLDLFVANHGSDTVTVYENVGTSTFTLLGHFPVGDGPNAIAVGDVDGDGHADVASANSRSSDVTLAAGNPHQLASVPLGDDPTPPLLAIGNRSESAGSISGTVYVDLDADGRDPDEVGLPGRLVYLDLGGNARYDGGRDPAQISGVDGAYSFSGLPPDTYEVRMELLPGWELTDPPALGVDRFQRIEVTLGADEQSAANDFGTRLYLGTGQIIGTVFFDSNANQANDLEPGLSGRTVYLDFNFDGHFDPTSEPSRTSDASGNYSFDNLPANRRYVVSLALEEGEVLTTPGTIQVENQFVAGDAPQSIAAADFNLDGVVDLAVARGGDATVSILFGHGDGTFAPPVPRDIGAAGVAVAAIFVDGDALPDLVVARQDFDGLTVLLNRPDRPGSFDIAYVVQGLTRPVDLEVADLDGDGDQDLLVANFGANVASRVTTDPPFCDGCGVSVVLNNAGVLEVVSVTPMTRNVTAVALGQFGGSAAIDAAAITNETLRSPNALGLSATDSSIEILINNGSGSLVAPISVPTGTYYLTDVAAADFDNDSDTDLAIAARTRPSGPIQPFCLFGFVLLVPFFCLAEDANGESGYLPSALESFPEQGYILLVENDATSFEVRSAVVGWLIDSIAAFQLDGDSTFELAISTDDSVVVYQVPEDVFLRTEAVEFDRHVFTGDPGQVAADDLDRDGDPDLFVADSAADGVAILRNRGDGTFQPAPIYGHEVVFPPPIATGRDFGLAGSEPDVDADGIGDGIEAAAPNGGDSNGDMTLDSDQAHVASLPNAVDGSYVTLVGPEDLRLVDVVARTGAPEPPPADVTLPIGLVGFRAYDLPPEGTIVIEVIVHGPAVPTTYYKYGPEPGNPASHWWEFSFDAATATGATVSGNVITLTFVDGGRGDADGVANGVIVDPGAPAIVAVFLDGDYNASGRVEQADLDLVLLNWGRDAVPEPAGWLSGLPAGRIDQDELDAVLLNWGASAAASAAPAPAAVFFYEPPPRLPPFAQTFITDRLSTWPGDTAATKRIRVDVVDLALTDLLCAFV
jgi:uncharacterized delta-60 repeat protein